MKKFSSFVVVGLFALASFSLTGCGGGGDNKVVEVESPPPEMSEQQRQSYEESMNSAKRGPGN